MSDLFGDEPRRRPAAPAPQASSGNNGRTRALVITGAVLVAAFLLLTVLSSFWTERLWFQNLGYLGVFSKVLWSRVGLFLVFGAVMAVVVGANMYVAYRFRPLFRPPSPEQSNLQRYREAVMPIRTWLLLGASLLVGLFAGGSATGQWRTFLLWRNGVDFGRVEPYFDRDIGFYMFSLAWWHYLVDFVMAMAIIALIAAALVHYLFGGIRLQGRDRLTGAAQAQLSVLLGVFVLAKAVDYYLDRFDLLSSSSGLITGITYTDDNAVLPAKNILAGIAVVCAILFFLNVWRRTWILPAMGLAMLALSALLLGLVWPGVVQQFQVDPTEADKEEPYIARNIEATRAAYQIEDAEMTPYRTAGEDVSEAEDQDVASDAINTPGVRLIDPNIVPAAFEQSQQIRGYYSVNDVLDVDQYVVQGTPRDLVLGVRELNQAGIADSSQNWANLHTVYTHGDGVIAAYGNQRPADNSRQTATEEPRWANPPLGDMTDFVGEYESRIYYGENSPTYSIVGKPSEGASDLELDLPITKSGEETEEANTTSTYEGEFGVPIGSLFHKVLYAIKFGEPNIVLSDRVHENSRILYDRDPAAMVEKVAPWLTVDADPYPAVIDGKVQWIIDGYTLSDRYPLSEKESFDTMTDDALNDVNSAFQTLPTDEINYIRNSVKATVDAYDGTVTLYAWDEEDPMLQAWSKAFPGTIQPKDQIEPELLDHLRYPEDLFKVQRYQLARYHVTDAADFYQANERWEVPADPNEGSTLQPPYRLSVTQGGDTQFSLTSTFVPVNRQNLAAYMTVSAEANEQDYGQIRVLDLAAGNGPQVSGPGQVASRVNADEDLQRALLSFTSGSESRAVYGNLLTLPVDDRLLYVQPIYTIRQTGDGTFPVLQFNAVSFGEDVGFGATFSEAVRDLLGVDETDAPDGGTGGGQGGGQGNGGAQGQGQGGGEDDAATQVRDLLDRADRLYERAQQALADQDLATYQQLTDQASQLVTRAIGLADQLPSPPASGGGNSGGGNSGGGDSGGGNAGGGN